MGRIALFYVELVVAGQQLVQEYAFWTAYIGVDVVVVAAEPPAVFQLIGQFAPWIVDIVENGKTEFYVFCNESYKRRRI